LLRADLLRAAALRGFHRQDRVSALRARFSERRVPRGVLAVRVAGARVEDLAVARLAFEHRSLTALGALDAGVLGLLERLHVAAVGVAAAADELAVAPALDHQIRAALGAGAPLDDLGLVRAAGGVLDVARVVAFGVAGAADEVAVAPEALGQALAALGAVLVQHLDARSLHGFL